MEQAISKDVALVEAAKEAFADNDIFGGGQNEKMEQVTAVLNIRRRRRREEVSLILRGNWSLPTVHMGHTPYMGWVPFQWWVGGGRLAEADPPLKWDKYPILVVGGGRKRRRSPSAPHPPPKWELYPISLVGPPPPAFLLPPTTRAGG